MFKVFNHKITVITATFFSMAAMTVADFLLKEKAEYFNSWVMFQVLFRMEYDMKDRFFIYQDQLGVFALPVVFIGFLILHGLIGFGIGKILALINTKRSL